MNNRELIEKIAHRVHLHGGTCYFVGGCVRDEIIGIESKDIDIEIYGIMPDRVRDLLNRFGEVVEIGASFGVYQIKGYNIDFSLPRREKKIGDKHTDFEIDMDPFISTYEATRRRDFTMNAIMKNVLTGDIIDHFNGIEDIRDRTIRHVDDDTFIEDPLRGLRMCQFAARFGFYPDVNTLCLIRKLDYSSLPKERIFEELKKMLLKGKRMALGLQTMKNTKILEKLLPEIDALSDVMQNPKYHAEGCVGRHTAMVLQELSEIRDKSKDPLALMLAGLLHDVGKHNTYRVTEKGITFHGHENESAIIASDILDRLTDDKKLKENVLNLVSNHMRPNKLAFEDSDKAIRKLMRDTDIHEILLLAQADHLGRISPGNTRPIGYGEYREWYDKKIKELTTPDSPIGTIEPIITGKDLIKMGFEPGPNFKELLKQTMEMQLEGCNEDMIILKLSDKEK